MEKTWLTDPNFDVTSSSHQEMGAGILLELKNHMVSHAGWTVVGSSDGATYEYLNEIAFPYLVDRAGTRTGTMTNMTYAGSLSSDTPGGTLSTRSLLLDGVDQFVTMGDALDFEYNDAFTISCWFKTTSTADGYLVSKLATGPFGLRGWGISYDGTTGGNLEFMLWSSISPSRRIQVDTTADYDDGNWHHLAITYNGTGVASGVAFFVDGSPAATTVTYDDLSSSTTVSSGSLNIGCRTDGSYCFNGLIDEVAVYGRWLSPIETQSLYNGGVPGDLSALDSAPDLVGWWRAELTGTTGGSYGGDSTGDHDVWASAASIPRAANGSNPGWCILRAPAGAGQPLYALIAMEGTSDSVNNGYFWFSDQLWRLHLSAPTAWLPTRVEGAMIHGHSRMTYYQTFSGTYTNRCYFSGASDGSFVYTQNLTIRTYFTGLIMFHLLDAAHEDIPTCSYVASPGAQWAFDTNEEFFAFHHPRPEYRDIITADPTLATSFGRTRAKASATYPTYEGNRVFATMTTTNYAGEVDAFPLFLVTDEYASQDTVEGQGVFVGRIPDLFSAPEGLDEADTMPSASPEHFILGDWILPGDTTPTLGP